jgi:hypothetical protein
VNVPVQRAGFAALRIFARASWRRLYDSGVLTGNRFLIDLLALCPPAG